MQDVLNSLAYSRALEILAYADGKPKRFTDICKDLGINSNIVNQRLKDLRVTDLVDKNGDGRYRVTQKGSRALQIAEQLEDLA